MLLTPEASFGPILMHEAAGADRKVCWPLAAGKEA